VNSDEIVDDVSVGPDKLGTWRKRGSLNGPVGGHGFENVYNLLWLRDRGVDGVMHLLPLSCMPETTVEPIINPSPGGRHSPLRLPDRRDGFGSEHRHPRGTFIELIKRKRKARSAGSN
jgi:hypothetical protein